MVNARIMASVFAMTDTKQLIAQRRLNNCKLHTIDNSTLMAPNGSTSSTDKAFTKTTTLTLLSPLNSPWMFTFHQAGRATPMT